MKTTLLLALAAVASAALAQNTVPPGGHSTPVTPAAPTAGPTPPLTLPTTAPTKPLLRSPSATDLAALVRDRSLTLDDAVAVSLLTSREFARSVANLELARSRTSEARAALNPTVGLNANTTEYSGPINAAFGGAIIPIQNQFVGVYGVAATLPLDISGSIRSAISQAQFSEVATRIDVSRTRNDVVYNVRNAFYQALRAQGALVVAEDSVANTEARFRDAQATLAAGTGTQFDVLTAQRDVSDARGQLVTTRANVTIALGQLKMTMGIDVSTPLSVSDAGAVEDPGAEGPAPAPPRNEDYHTARNEVDLGADYQSVVAEAVQNRPEILEQNAAVAAAQKGVQYARRSQLPQLSISAGYSAFPNFAGFTPANQGTIAIGLSIPIYDGGLARARVREARATVAQYEVDRRTAIDQVTLDVQQAYVNEVQARERVRVATLGVTTAREAFRLAQLRARAGVSAIQGQSPQIELSNAQVSLSQAETNRVNALYDYNVARAALDRARGRFSYGPGGPQGSGVGAYPAPPTPKETGATTPATLTKP